MLYKNLKDCKVKTKEEIIAHITKRGVLFNALKK